MELGEEDVKLFKTEIREESITQMINFELHSEIELGKYECLVPKEEEDADDPLTQVNSEPLEEPMKLKDREIPGPSGNEDTYEATTTIYVRGEPEDELMELGNRESPDPLDDEDTSHATTIYIRGEPEVAPEVEGTFGSTIFGQLSPQNQGGATPQRPYGPAATAKVLALPTCTVGYVIASVAPPTPSDAILHFSTNAVSVPKDHHRYGHQAEGGGLVQKKCDQSNRTMSLDTSGTIRRLISRENYFHQCPECGKRLTSSGRLNRHILSHETKPHQCNLCSSRFRRADDLKKHVVVHSGEKPYQCNLCPGRFSHPSNLRKHVLNHGDKKPYQCNMCPSSFNRSDNLRTHLLSHTGDRPHQCNLCPYRSNYEVSLRRHKRTHTNDKPYKCQLCSYCSTEPGHLARHVRLIHKR